MPLVVADRHTLDESLDQITADNRKGGYLAACHLLDLGHRDIAYITGRPDRTPNRERLGGFHDAMTEAGVNVRPEWVYHEPLFDFTHARGIVHRLMEMPDMPTAICFGNDYMALGGLSALSEGGFAVPDGVSIVGFDDIWMAALSRPALTTVRQPIERMGEIAFELLLERMISDRPTTGKRIVLDVRLIQRDSTKPLQA